MLFYVTKLFFFFSLLYFCCYFRDLSRLTGTTTIFLCIRVYCFIFGYYHSVDSDSLFIILKKRLLMKERKRERERGEEKNITSKDAWDQGDISRVNATLFTEKKEVHIEPENLRKRLKCLLLHYLNSVAATHTQCALRQTKDLKKKKHEKTHTNNYRLWETVKRRTFGFQQRCQYRQGQIAFTEINLCILCGKYAQFSLKKRHHLLSIKMNCIRWRVHTEKIPCHTTPTKSSLSTCFILFSILTQSAFCS